MFKEIKSYFISEQLLEMTSFHDETRVKLLYNISFSVLILGFVGTLISLTIGTYAILVPTLGNVILGLTSLLLIKFFDFRLAGKMYFSALFLLLYGNLLFNFGTMHIGSPFWIIILNILIIYVLGKTWGVVFMILSGLGFGYYLVFVFPVMLDIIHNLPPEIYYSTLYETGFALFLLGYVIFTILNASRDSDQLLRDKNDVLNHRNETIISNNEEKTIMLKEIHHRVKNNLQVIISLMRLQMRELKSEEALLNFNDTINRVLTMAKIHEKIYQSDTLSQVNLDNYFHDLSNDLIANFETNFKVGLKFTFEIEKVGLKTIVPLALIFNELFSNSLKHAFDGVENPIIQLCLTEIDDKSFMFEYTDNGKWKKVEDENSFGLELIDTLTCQLDGEFEFKETPATYYKFKFNRLEL